jgi:poly(A) polymerase
VISSDSKKIIKVLGGDGVTRFVGGCVRNYLLGEPAGDIDLATKLLPDEVMKRLKGAGIKVVPTGIEHGTVTAILNKKPFEVTTLRRDVETDGRRAVVAFTEDWDEDAKRRDFTMNTLSADLDGAIYDPLGRGVSDLHKGKVVFVGDATERIREDYLRVLRFFRFHARYGKGAPDKAALVACAAASRKLKTLSKERVTQEFVKLLEVTKSPKILTLMRQNNLLLDVVSPSYEESRLISLIKKQNEPDEAARLVIVAGLNPAGVKKMEASLRLPLKTLAKMRAILDALKTLKTVSDHSVKLSLYLHGREATIQALYICNAPTKAVKLGEGAEIPVFPVTGKVLMKEGYAQGPELGLELKKREAKWIRHGFC